MKIDSKSKDSIEFVNKFEKLDTNSKQFLSGYILAKVEEKEKLQQKRIRGENNRGEYK
ncbi:MAG: hypothetical protein ACK5L6_03760 [Anaerorhabdus sp.]|uniref:hypothetical protein n=1 Tax=Anaerorhabdus sp. TaxID=1872524 RepID=UPI003A8648C1